MLKHYNFLKRLITSKVTSKEYSQHIIACAQLMSLKICTDFADINLVDIYDEKKLPQLKKQLSYNFDQISAIVSFDIIDVRATDNTKESYTIEAAAQIYAFWVEVAAYAGSVCHNLYLENAIVAALNSSHIGKLFDKGKPGYRYLPKDTQTKINMMNDSYRYTSGRLINQQKYLIPFSTYFYNLEHAVGTESTIYGNLFFMQSRMGNYFGIDEKDKSDIESLFVKYNADDFGVNADDVIYQNYNETKNLLLAQAMKSKDSKVIQKDKTKFKVAKDLTDSKVEKKKESKLEEVYLEKMTQEYRLQITEIRLLLGEIEANYQALEKIFIKLLEDQNFVKLIKYNDMSNHFRRLIGFDLRDKLKLSLWEMFLSKLDVTETEKVAEVISESSSHSESARANAEGSLNAKKRNKPPLIRKLSINRLSSYKVCSTVSFDSADEQTLSTPKSPFFSSLSSSSNMSVCRFSSETSTIGSSMGAMSEESTPRSCASSDIPSVIKFQGSNQSHTSKISVSLISSLETEEFSSEDREINGFIKLCKLRYPVQVKAFDNIDFEVMKCLYELSLCKPHLFDKVMKSILEAAEFDHVLTPAYAVILTKVKFLCYFNDVGLTSNEAKLDRLSYKIKHNVVEYCDLNEDYFDLLFQIDQMVNVYGNINIYDFNEFFDKYKSKKDHIPAPHYVSFSYSDNKSEKQKDVYSLAK
ncbi:hypothetical protein L3V82_10175 [Thiotrichales bacterium 19S3-7]|nr:hypothetical protein [Thiotrichales bacterium 19S3-7]MCF6802522.1 hypothetical protein [Thiotrichales bacterium 19S3-11]